MPADAPDLFAEGVVVPPMRLMREDRVVVETVALFRANSRTPDAVAATFGRRSPATTQANGACSSS